MRSLVCAQKEHRAPCFLVTDDRFSADIFSITVVFVYSLDQPRSVGNLYRFKNMKEHLPYVLLKPLSGLNMKCLPPKYSCVGGFVPGGWHYFGGSGHFRNGIYLEEVDHLKQILGGIIFMSTSCLALSSWSNGKMRGPLPQPPTSSILCLSA